jgi:hypothetical protein
MGSEIGMTLKDFQRAKLILFIQFCIQESKSGRAATQKKPLTFNS